MNDPNFHPMYQPPAVTAASPPAPETKGSARDRRKRRIAQERAGWVLTFHKFPFVRPRPPIGRNKPCRCGSVVKRKKCHPDL